MNTPGPAKDAAESGEPLSVGDLVREQRLGSEAVYRVFSCSARLVEVEVVEAPGLVAGQRFAFTRPAVERMERVSSLAPAPAPKPVTVADRHGRSGLATSA